MSNEYVDVGRYAVVAMTAEDCIAHKHRHAIEFYSVNLNRGVREIMHIVVKSVDIGSI